MKNEDFRTRLQRLGRDDLSMLRHPIRAGASAIAAAFAVWAFASGVGVWAVVLGAILGVAAGELLDRSDVRLPVVLLGALVLVILGRAVSGFSLNAEVVPRMLGPGGAIAFSTLVKYFVYAFGAVTSLRFLTRRIQETAPLEIAAHAACVAIMFSAHRDGIIVRPLWLSDWAWQRGIDPVHVLLAIGALAVIVLIGLVVAESRDRLTISSLIALPILGIIFALSFNVTGLPEPDAGNNLGLTTDPQEGDPPNPMDEGMDRPGGEGEEGEEQTGQQQEDMENGQGGAQQPQDPQFDQVPQESQSPAPMAVVILGDDYSPPSHGFYFRQEAWSDYTGRRLVTTRRSDVDNDLLLRWPVRETYVEEEPGSVGRQHVQADVALLVEHTAPFALESPVLFEPTANPDPTRFVRSYRFESLAQDLGYEELLGGTSGLYMDPEVLEYYTEAPDDERYQELADEILANVRPEHLRDPFAVVLAIKLWLDQNLIYSTQHDHAGADDPTAEFLFGDRIGYCVHFAHAAVFLFRTMGIPSRVAAGYYVPETNLRGSTIVITGSNAHAWPEVWVDGMGWVVVDVNAEQVLDGAMPPVDDALVEMLGEIARGEPPDPSDLSASPQSRNRLGRLLWSMLLAILISSLLGLYGAKIWRRYAPWMSNPRHMPRLGYRLALDLLSEAGHHRHFGETRERFARRMAQETPAFSEMTDWNVSVSLRNPSMDESGRPEFQKEAWLQRIAALRDQLSSSTKRSRRIAGMLNPFSFLQSR